MGERKQSGGSPAGTSCLGSSEEVGTQLLASDPAVSYVLDRDTPLGIEVYAAGDPRGNGLLLDGGAIGELTNGLGESRLASSNLDGALKRDNVRFLHGREGYTNRFVSVNKPVCVTGDKEVCIVLDMAIAKKQLRPSKASERVAVPGPDGRTLGQRLEMAMAHRGGQLGTEYTATDLIRDANRIAGASDDSPVISQQMVSAIIRGKVTRSNFTPYLAEACGVRSAWLAQGAGKMVNPA